MTLAGRLLTACAFLAATALSAGADPVTFDTAQGPMTLPETPERIVALDVSAIDTITALGVIPAGVVAPLYVDYLPEALKDATPVGTFFEPDFEAIAALAPDVIVVGPRAAAMADALSRIAPVADMSVGTDAFADGRARLAAFGAMLGRADAAAALDADLQARLDEVRGMVAAQGGNALIVMTNGPKLSVFGPNSRFGWLHIEVGFAPAVEGITDNRHGEAVSFEYIAEADPATLLVVDRGAAIGDGSDGAKATLDNPLVAGTKAARAGRVIYLSPAELYIATGGIRSLTRTLDEIAAALGAM
ncbi:iron ABC transporter substrate-binding protein [Oceanicola sp. 22II-s10i]|uniref:siderophore ABC transporter substrate-binding protein n=1 Tax=Oceanicola sp. 22II-s10i TaxID=1317116 RepID=UPI000B51F706|nr:siderophore ABC transporter substrate-binding protein [Oceanicola sp. 22II-s10i]OWU82994.1 iron ABC transporter substrate-binding protein [Oceanicola sp. 22II-s10i]